MNNGYDSVAGEVSPNGFATLWETFIWESGDIEGSYIDRVPYFHY